MKKSRSSGVLAVVLFFFGFLITAQQNASAAPAETPRTGQMACYIQGSIDCGGTGQDADLLKGVAWPDPRFTYPDNGTFVDNLTGLVWSVDANAPGPAMCGPGTNKTWGAAVDYVDCINSGAGYLGFTDWRLPNVNEMKSLLNAGQSSPGLWLRNQGFMGVQFSEGSTYWTSSMTLYKNYRWFVEMSNGSVDFNTDTALRSIWPVRGGECGSGAVCLPKTGQTDSVMPGDDGSLQKGVAWPEPRFSDNGDSTVTDSLTGLMWTKDGNNAAGPQVCGNTAAMEWQVALNYVKCLNSGSGFLGFTDWRLPNRNELRSLVKSNLADTSAWLNTQGFANAQRSRYWSSTSYEPAPWFVWTVDMGTGAMNAYDKYTDSVFVWPVRSAQTASSAQLTITKAGAGTGTVTSSVASFVWSGVTGTATVSSNLSVPLTASPASGSKFAGWSGDADCLDGQVTMNSDKTCIATFDAALPVLTVAPAAVSFNDQAIGTITVVKVKVRNTGDGPLFFTAIGKAGVDQKQFSVMTDCQIGGAGLAAGATCIVKAKFKPTTAGAMSALLTIDAEAPGVSTTVALTGTGIGPVAKVTPLALSFADQVINTASLPLAVKVSNTGNAPLLITGITKGGANAGQFSFTTTCTVGGAALPAGQNCMVKVKFRPTTVGARSASLAIDFEAPALSRTVALSGTGVVAPIPGAPTGVTATPGNSQVTVNWPAVSGATSYNLYWSTSTGVTTANGTKITNAVSPYTHTGLTNGSNYYYIVTAVSSGGESPASSQASAKPTGYVSVATWGSSGTGDGQFAYPRGVVVDPAGNIYVADTNNNRIQKLNSSGVFITKWGTTGYGDGQFSSAYKTALDAAGNIYVADFGNNRIQKFNSSGVYLTQWGTYGTGNGQFKYTQDMAVDGSGNVYVVDGDNNRVQKFTSGGVFITKWGSLGSSDGQFDNPRGIAVDSSGNVYVTDWTSRIQKFDSNGVFITKWGAQGTGDGLFYWPEGIAVDSSGNVYVADSGNSLIHKFTSNGAFITKWNGQLTGPFGVAVDSSGNVFVADTYNHRIQKFTLQ